MRAWLTVLAATIIGCGDSAPSTETGGRGAAGEGDTRDADEPDEEPQCRTVDVVNPAAGEKINAAFCVGLGYDDQFECNFDSQSNITRCEGSSYGFEVRYSVQQGVDVGTIVDLYDGSVLGIVYQAADGAFQIEIGDALARCTVVGDVATLCLD